MKKIAAITLCVLLLASVLTGCSGTKEFTCQELTMTVPFYMSDASSQSDFKDFTFTLDSSKIAIFGIKEDFEDFPNGESTTLDEYAKLVIEANELDTFASQRSNYDYKYFRYESSSSDGLFKYLTAVYKGPDGFWSVQFAAKVADYDETAFFEYLDSVKFS